MVRFTQLNHKQRVVSRYKDLFSMMKIYHLTQKQYLDRRSKIQESNSYQRLTNYNREFMRGMEEMFFACLYRYCLIFCYDYQGKRYAINSKEYKKLSPKDVVDHSTFNGHCYRDDLSKCYYEGKNINGRM